MTRAEKIKIVRDFVGNYTFDLSINFCYDYNDDEDSWDPIITSFDDAEDYIRDTDNYVGDLVVTHNDYDNDWNLLIPVIGKILNTKHLSNREETMIILNSISKHSSYETFNLIADLLHKYNTPQS